MVHDGEARIREDPRAATQSISANICNHVQIGGAAASLKRPDMSSSGGKPLPATLA